MLRLVADFSRLPPMKKKKKEKSEHKKRKTCPFLLPRRVKKNSFFPSSLPPMLASTSRRVASGLLPRLDLAGCNGVLGSGAFVAAADSLLPSLMMSSAASTSASASSSAAIMRRSLSTDTDIRKVLADKIPEQQVRERKRMSVFVLLISTKRKTTWPFVSVYFFFNRPFFFFLRPTCFPLAALAFFFQPQPFFFCFFFFSFHKKNTLQDRLRSLKKAHGSKELGNVTVDMCIGGMRGITVRNGNNKKREREKD